MTDPFHERLQQSLGTSYTLERELGGGGMSRVFLARDEALGRRVVLKMLPPELVAGVNADRFEREIRMAAALQHPHIVPLHAAGWAGDIPFYSMPYVEGQSLRARITDGPIAVAEVVSILRDVARALAYAHERGVVHRDIKPDNVLLSSSSAVVTDFGIAKALDASRTAASGSTLTQIGMSVGTPAYMAPEQAAADPNVDRRADIYSFGCLAFELLTSQPPFAAVTPQRLLAAHMSETPRDVRTLRPDTPAALATLVSRCLAKDPAHRPENANDILRALEAIHVPAAQSRSRRWYATVAAALALVATLVVASTMRSRTGTPETPADGPAIMLAVLPFEHDGPEDQAPFTNGLTDALTAKLGALPGLAVIDRQSAAQYRRTTKPAKQIGAELGVPYLVEGVVRWARTGATWSAQVTPTLVDARAGVTKWSGQPVVITPQDPFSAQAAIAENVASALRVALRPSDRAVLAHRQTNNPDAFAAYQRGLALMSEYGRSGSSLGPMRLATAQFERAIELDSSYADAWVRLAATHLQFAIDNPGDRAVEAKTREIFALAVARAPDDPLLLQTAAYKKIFWDHDTVGADALTMQAIAAAPNNAFVLVFGSFMLAFRQHKFDSAMTLASRAATLDPRNASVVNGAASLARLLRRWDDAGKYADRVIALDSADERGWVARTSIGQLTGDSLRVSRDVALMLGHVPHPSARLLSFLPSGGADLARRYVAMSVAEIGPRTLVDTILWYFGPKGDAALRIGDAAGSRAFADSIVSRMLRREMSGPNGTALLERLAFAYSATGRTAEARTTLDRVIKLARSSSSDPFVGDVLSPVTVAGTYARLAEPEKAVAWLDGVASQPAGSWTAPGFANEPKLFMLRGNSAFQRLIRER